MEENDAKVQAHLLEMSFVFGYISGSHPIHVSDGAVVIGVMFLRTLDSNGTVNPFLWKMITSTFKSRFPWNSYKWYYSQSISLAKYA